MRPEIELRERVRDLASTKTALCDEGDNERSLVKRRELFFGRFCLPSFREDSILQAFWGELPPFVPSGAGGGTFFAPAERPSGVAGFLAGFLPDEIP
ncbi:MAG: hypothetical protein ABI233_08715 [Chthoniobacterales bacterium]